MTRSSMPTRADGSIRLGTGDALTSTDALVWTLKLRPNIKFSDGTPYDAAAVKFNWLAASRTQPRRTGSQAHGQPDRDDGRRRPADAADDVEWGKNVASHRRSPGLPAVIGSPKAITAKGDQFTNDPVGAGPFILKSLVTRETARSPSVHNPTYWDSGAPAPNADQLVFLADRPPTRRSGPTRCARRAATSCTSDGRSEHAESACEGAVSEPNSVVQNSGTGLQSDFDVTRAAVLRQSACARPINLAIDRATEYTR